MLTETNVSGTIDCFVRFCLACPPFHPLPLGNPCMARVEMFGAFPAAEYHCKNFRSSPFVSATASVWLHMLADVHRMQAESQMYCPLALHLTK